MGRILLQTIFTAPGFLGAFVAIFAVIFTAISMSSGQRASQLASIGVEGVATVIEKEIERGSSIGKSRTARSPSRAYVVHYRFTAVDGTEYRGKSGLPETWWKAISEGEQMAVYYLPDDPRTSEIWAERAEAESNVTRIIAILAWIAAAVGLSFGFVRAVRG